MKTFFVAILATSYFSDIFGHHSLRDVPCAYYQKTSVQKKRLCSIRVSPLCASNNVTYSNTCVYCFANMDCQTIYQSSCNILQSHKQCMKVQISPHPPQRSLSFETHSSNSVQWKMQKDRKSLGYDVIFLCQA